MNKPVFALVSATVLGVALPLLAAPHERGGRGGPPRSVVGPGYGGGGFVGVRPGHGGYRGYGHAGWRGGYWGPRVGFYYGGPGYWGGWPGAWGAWPGVWAASYAYPYNVAYSVAPIIINSTPQTQLYVQPAATAAPQVTPEISYWYYCIQPAGYFPYVKDCSEPWLKVVPQAPGEQPTAPRLAP